MAKERNPGWVRLGKRLRQMRELAGWTQDDLADKMSEVKTYKMGVDEYTKYFSRYNIKDVELGEAPPSKNVLPVLLKVFASQPFGLQSPQEAQEFVADIPRLLSREELRELFPDWPEDELVAAGNLGIRRGSLPEMAFAPPLLKKHVERRLLGRVVEMVTA